MKKLLIPILICFCIHIGVAQKATNMSTPKISTDGTVYFGVMENPPVLSSCKNAGNSAQVQSCMKIAIYEFVSENFDASVSKKLTAQNDKSLHATHVRFVVTKNGNVENITIRTKNTLLQDELTRVLKKLPAFTKGTHKGVAVDVSYNITIDGSSYLNHNTSGQKL